MSDPVTDPAREPGERRPGVTSRLDRAPGERYAQRTPGGAASPAGVPSPGRRMRALAAAAVAAAIGALVIFALGLVEIGPGLIAVSAAVGWAVALALVWGSAGAGFESRGTRTAIAAALGATGIIVGFLLNWGWSRAEGGVLDPAAYLDQRYGLLAIADIVVAALAGALRAR